MFATPTHPRRWYKENSRAYFRQVAPARLLATPPAPPLDTIQVEIRSLEKHMFSLSEQVGVVPLIFAKAGRQERELSALVEPDDDDCIEVFASPAKVKKTKESREDAVICIE